jgi:hypothetical protein
MNRGLFILFFLITAWQTNAQVYKRYFPSSSWTNININCKLNEKEEIVTHISLRRPFNSQYVKGLSNNLPFNQFEFIHFFGGYQYQPTPHWLLHGSIRYRIENFGTNVHTLIPRVMLGHIGIHKNIRFVKQIMFERLQELNIRSNSYNQARFLIGISNQFTINESRIIPVFSLEFFKNIASSTDNQPRFSKSRLRFDIIYDINKKVGIGFFATRNISYLYLLGTYDEFGKEVTPKGRYNYITPIYGFQLFYKLKRGDIFPITY